MRGRPPYAPTKAHRRNVSIWAGGGMAEEAIALVLGISRTTLRKHFAVELTTGAGERRAEMVQAMFKAGKAGNVTAQRAFLARTDPGAPPVDRTGRNRPMGRKEVVERAAVAAGTDSEWGEDLAPLPGTLPN